MFLTYKEEEKFRVQGINDLIVFSTMALASLSAGIMLSLTSWDNYELNMYSIFSFNSLFDF